MSLTAPDAINSHIKLLQSKKILSEIACKLICSITNTLTNTFFQNGIKQLLHDRASWNHTWLMTELSQKHRQDRMGELLILVYSGISNSNLWPKNNTFRFNFQSHHGFSNILWNQPWIYEYITWIYSSRIHQAWQPTLWTDFCVMQTPRKKPENQDSHQHLDKQKLAF